jgi:DNA-binding response OmpR family regulator
VLSVNLEAAGYQVATAADGLQALYALDHVQPDLVLLDLHLPLVSGFRIIQLLKQRGSPRPVPVVVLTALSYQEAEQALRFGADDFLTKPFHPQEVVIRVQRVLARG